MAVTVKVIIPAKQAENTDTAQYTASNCKTIIDKFTATNTSGADATLSVNLVTFGGSVSASNLIMDARTISPNETYTCPELVGHSLDSGGVISTVASAASSITIRASGREITA